MDFAALYKSKLTTPEEAVKVVKSGDWVDYGWCTGTPNALDKALAARMDELENVTSAAACSCVGRRFSMCRMLQTS